MDADVEHLLKTPRQVVPFLLHVSSGSRVHKLSRIELANNDRALPVSSTTVQAREAKVAAVAAGSNAAHVAAAKPAYASTNVHTIERVTDMPFPDSTGQNRSRIPVGNKHHIRASRHPRAPQRPKLWQSGGNHLGCWVETTIK